MTVFDVLTLFCGLALFLYGMEIMGDSLKKSAGNQLKVILGKMTSSPLRGFLLGLGVTAVIQSSSATTVMVVGFVNSGTMTLLQSVGVIMGANVGTAVTAWITALSSIGEGGSTLAWIEWLKPDAWMPVLAVIGICLIMFVKRGKKKDVGNILLGFAVLMVGMDLMSGSVSGLKGDPAFQSILTMFENPILGIFAGLILTVIVQSSSASVGILQSLTVTGAITYGAAVPIIMGQNIGTCVTALISSISANKNGKRAAIIHLYFNIIGVIIWLSIFYIVNAIFSLIPTEASINAWGVAGVHTIFKMLSVLAIAPFYKQLEKLAVLTVRDKKDKNETVNRLDERLFETPSIAAEQAANVTFEMAEASILALKKSLTLFDNYDARIANEVRDLEEKADKYEDALGSYLVKLSGYDMDSQDAVQVTKLLHIIGDLERISDHSVNIVESAEEMKDKKLSFSEQATKEMRVMRSAIEEILDITERCFVENDTKLAVEVEPIEEVVDELRDKIKLNHVLRLQKNECTIEHGFVLSDLLNNFERVSDHCSNVAGCVIEMAKEGTLDMHKYTEETIESVEYKQKVVYYQQKYSI
jgi:phosphate:Na+ symporter